MKLLLDTNIILMTAFNALPEKAVAMIKDPVNSLYFSSISIWETVIKNALKKRDFQIDPSRLHHSLLANGYVEIKLNSRHSLHVASLPGLHKDPFDRILLAQAAVEGLTLLTSDSIVARYPGDIIHVV